MKNKTALALTLLTILLHVTECKTTPDYGSNIDINGTAFIIGDDELPMDLSELSRRVLAGSGNAKTIDIEKSLKGDKVTCNSNVQGSCVGNESKFYKKRACDYSHTCRN